MGTGKHRRLVAANRDLLRKERLISEILGLRAVPRLSLLDEASATYVTGDERGDLDGDQARHKRHPTSGGPEGRPAYKGMAAKAGWRRGSRL